MNKVDVHHFFCASCSSSVLNGIGPFKNLGKIQTPWGMKDAMSNIRYPKQINHGVHGL
ncbi:Uncharacterised protein [Citrobacter amalonaticus]|nr:Uncharacterised protein [Citrobacter amalonaticus]